MGFCASLLVMDIASIFLPLLLPPLPAAEAAVLPADVAICSRGICIEVLDLRVFTCVNKSCAYRRELALQVLHQHLPPGYLARNTAWEWATVR